LDFHTVNLEIFASILFSSQGVTRKCVFHADFDVEIPKSDVPHTDFCPLHDQNPIGLAMALNTGNYLLAGDFICTV
jgi:hypothetical protein